MSLCGDGFPRYHARSGVQSRADGRPALIDGDDSDGMGGLGAGAGRVLSTLIDACSEMLI